jgi:hypothetical protein
MGFGHGGPQMMNLLRPIAWPPALAQRVYKEIFILLIGYPRATCSTHKSPVSPGLSATSNFMQLAPLLPFSRK